MLPELGNVYSEAAGAAMSQQKTMTKAEREKVALEFESLFLSQMLQSLFPEKDPSLSEEEASLGDPFNDEAYRAMMINEYAKQMAATGGIGIAAQVQQELLKQQEINTATTTGEAQ